MDTIQWARVMRKAMEEIDQHLEQNEEGLLRAFTKGQGKISINLGVTIVSESSYSADVQSSISYVVEKFKKGNKERVILAQEELPLPDATTTGLKRSGGGSITPKQAKAVVA